MALQLLSHARTDVGRVREHNEDNFLVDRKLGLFVVADGMGGHAAGEVASAVAVQALREALKKDADFIEDFLNDDKSVRPEDIKNLLEAAARAANAAVYAEAQSHPEKRGMGTTLTALMLLNDHGFIAHVGDSRCYMLRGHEVRMLTEDHSVLNELKRRGKLRPEIVEKLQVKNAVTRAVGVFETVEVDTFHFLVAPGDRFVLCSDGLHGYLNEDREIAELLANLTEEAATQRLVDLANERGGKDNITAIVVSVPEGAPDTARDVTLAYETLASMAFFRFLEPRELLRVQAIAKHRRFQCGEAVVREGEPGESIFVVLTGRASVRKGDNEIAALGPGEHFGEMALVDKTPRSATVLSKDESRMLEISRADFFKLLREEKDIGIKLLWNFVNVLTQRLRNTSRELGEAKEALSAEDLTDALFAEDETPAIPPAARLPTLPDVRRRHDTLEDVHLPAAPTLAAPPPVPDVDMIDDEMPTIPPPPPDPKQ